MSSIGIIILNYNNSAMTFNLINNIENIENNIKKINIVVDNKSSNEERGLLINLLNDYVILQENEINKSLVYGNKKFLILLNDNYGYAKGNNFGINLSFNLGCEYSVISNNDIVLDKPVIETLIKDLQDDKSVGIVGPKIIEKNGKIVLPRKRRNFYYDLFAPILIPLSNISKIFFSMYFSNEKFPYWVTGCFIVIRNKAIIDAGYYDENTFLFFEEAIIAEKLLKIGYKNMYDSSVSVKHLHGKSVVKLKNEKINKSDIYIYSSVYYFENYLKYTQKQIRILLIIKKINQKVMYIYEKIFNFIKN